MFLNKIEAIIKELVQFLRISQIKDYKHYMAKYEHNEFSCAEKITTLNVIKSSKKKSTLLSLKLHE